MEENQIKISAIPDPRTDEEKAQDFTHTEILGSGIETPAIAWKEKPMLNWNVTSLRKQITSSSCGGQSAAEVLEDFFKLVISASPTYRFRKNFPGQGMWQQDIGDILKKKKTTSEDLCRSQNMTEEEMDSVLIPTDLPYGIGGYYFLPIRPDLNMDLIAKALEAGHGIIFLIDSNAEEWQEVPVPTTAVATFSHFVGASNKQNYLLHNGVKSVVVSDSCNAFSTIKKIDGSPSGQRILTEDFIRSRCYGIMALFPELEFQKEKKPFYIFDDDLVYGSIGNDVAAWQRILQYEQLLPTKTSDGSTLPLGNFLSMTAQATKKWQVSHGLAAFVNETDMRKIRVGPKTRALANKMYGTN